MSLGIRWGVLDGIDSWESFSLILRREQVDQAMKGDARHYVNEETGYFVEAVENHRISPHSYSNGVVSKCEAVCTDEKTFRVGEEPDCAHAKEVDKIAKIRQEVVIASFVIRIITNRHEVEQL